MQLKNIAFCVVTAIISSANIAQARQERDAMQLTTKSPALQHLEKARSEFYTARPRQPIFRREIYDINYNIRYDSHFSGNRQTLTVDKAWQAVMEKAFNPVKYIPHAILKGKVLKDTLLDCDEAAYFIRISLQRPMDDNETSTVTVVREEVSIDKINKLVYFMGRPPEPNDYQLLGIKAGETKQQILFLDEHKIVSVDNDPLDVWTLIALPTKGFNRADEQTFVDRMGKDPGKPYRIYLQARKL